MTTRSGRTYKPEMSLEEATPTPTESTTPPDDAATPLPAAGEIAGLLEFMRGMLQDRTEERRHYEDENEKRLHAMTKQMELLERIVTDRKDKEYKKVSDIPKLTRLSDSDDIESYLTTFERMMTVYEVAPEKWAFNLAPQLTGRAQQVYAALDTADAQSYDAVKAAILRRYNINEETYRKRFRALKFKHGQSPTELVTRLSDIAGKWLKDCKTVEDIKDAVVKEQLLSALPDDVRVWVSERKPNTSTEAGQLAEDYLQARTSNALLKTERQPPGPCPRCSEHGHWARHCPNNPRQESSAGKMQPLRPSPTPSGYNRYRRNTAPKPTDLKPRAFLDGVKCYNCNEKGHLASNCPQKALFCSLLPPEASEEQERVCHHGTVNGIYTQDIVADTGASKTLVHGSFVTPTQMTDKHITISCAHGDSITYPLADVKIAVGKSEFVIQAAVVDRLPVAALLGWDIPHLTQFVKPNNLTPALAAVTRQQKQTEAAPPPPSPTPTQPAVTTDDNPADDSGSASPDDEDQQTELSNYLFNFDDSVFSPAGPDKIPLTRAQKRLQRQRHSQPDTTADIDEHSPSHISANELRSLQQADPTLANARQAADVQLSTDFFYRDCILYRRYDSPKTQETIDQLVLPVVCRPPVLKLAHDIPLA